jgi:hypothetical protein
MVAYGVLSIVWSVPGIAVTSTCDQLDWFSLIIIIFINDQLDWFSLIIIIFIYTNSPFITTPRERESKLTLV